MTAPPPHLITARHPGIDALRELPLGRLRHSVSALHGPVWWRTSGSEEPHETRDDCKKSPIYVPMHAPDCPDGSEICYRTFVDVHEPYADIDC